MERTIAQKILRELLEMLEDEENLVKKEAFSQMACLVSEFTEEDLDQSSICQVLQQVYSAPTEHVLREILDLMVMHLGRFLFKLGARRVLDGLLLTCLSFVASLYRRSREEAGRAVRAQEDSQDSLDPDMDSEDGDVVPLRRLRGEQEAEAVDKEFCEDETRKHVVLNFPALTLCLLAKDAGEAAAQIWKSQVLALYDETCGDPSGYVRSFCATVNNELFAICQKANIPLSAINHSF